VGVGVRACVIQVNIVVEKLTANCDAQLPRPNESLNSMHSNAKSTGQEQTMMILSHSLKKNYILNPMDVQEPAKPE
jgi:hypothetical protein